VPVTRAIGKLRLAFKEGFNRSDIANMAGVCDTMVSFVLNWPEGVSVSENTSERVWQAVEKLKYHLPYRIWVCTPMQWTSAANAGFSGSNTATSYSPVFASEDFEPARVNVRVQQAGPASPRNPIRQMLQIRKQNSAFG
jgi:glycosidase